MSNNASQAGVQAPEVNTIPAKDGFSVMRLRVSKDGESHVIERIPVIAWRIITKDPEGEEWDHAPIPITAWSMGKPMAGEVRALILPNGSVRSGVDGEPYSVTHEDLTSWIMEMEYRRNPASVEAVRS